MASAIFYPAQVPFYHRFAFSGILRPQMSAMSVGDVNMIQMESDVADNLGDGVFQRLAGFSVGFPPDAGGPESAIANLL
jgi:hypothetical protein